MSENNSNSPKFLQENIPILYTVSPPKNAEMIPNYLETLKPTFLNKNIHAFSSPELNNRTEENNKVIYQPTTIPPEDFLAEFPKTFDLVSTFVVPKIPKGNFLQRLEYMRIRGINTTILVGPEKQSDIKELGGYTVQEGLEIAANNNFTCGGITIPWRKVPVSSSSSAKPIPEHERIALKQKSGCKFVTSQLVFEFESPCQLIYDYANYCRENKLDPLTIFFSFCVVPSEKTLDFLYKLDVKIPPGQRFRLLKASSIEQESIELACDIWGSIKDSQRSNAKNVKIGLQIEQIKIDRAVKSVELLDRLLEV